MLVRDLLQWSRLDRKGNESKRRLMACERVEVKEPEGMRKWKSRGGECKGMRNRSMNCYCRGEDIRVLDF